MMEALTLDSDRSRVGKFYQLVFGLLSLKRMNGTEKFEVVGRVFVVRPPGEPHAILCDVKSYFNKSLVSAPLS